MLNSLNDAILRLVARFKSEEGQALAEYGLILGLIAVVAIAALTALGLGLSGKLGSLTSALGGGGSA